MPAAYRRLQASTVRIPPPLLSSTLSLRLDRVHRLALVFMPLALAIVVIGLFALHSVDVVAASQDVVSHTYAIQAQISVVEARLVDDEDALRGYLLTGDTMYLTSYTTGRHTLTAAIDRLRILTEGDAAEQRRIATLVATIEPLQNLWQQSIDLRSQQRTEEAVALASSDQAKQWQASLHVLLAEMDVTEEHALTVQLSAAGNSVSETHLTILLATVIDSVLLVALFVLIWYSIATRERHLRAESAARAAAEEAVALRDNFLSIASHELRTPVATLLGNLQLLERYLPRPGHVVERDARIQQCLAAMQRQIGRLQALIATMLDVSRIESGQLTIARDPLDLVALVRGVVDEMRPIAQAHPIDLVVPFDSPRASPIRGDAARLEQALLNLLQNAIKYSAEGSPIRVEVQRTADWALVTVTDQGIGIPEDVLPHVFERFYRAPEVRSEYVSGMGIGLYLVHEIVALHGGEVTVTSAHGAGTTVTMCLPLAMPQDLLQESS